MVSIIKANDKEVPKLFNLIAGPPPPFIQCLKTRPEDGKFHKFISWLKQLCMNNILVKALEKMPSYAKFIKNLMIKKRIVSF